jgi:hypothetical protein
MTVKLVIKSAAQTVDDFSLDCDITSTIGQVKEKITELYPTNPTKENQKLIYGGKLLPDHLSLKSVLNHTQERHIIHLVCPSPIYVNTKEQSISKEDTSEPFSVPPPNPAFPPGNQPILNPPSFSGMPGVTVAPLNTGDAFQQYIAMQQMYSQFMMQYLSQYNGGVPPVIPYSPVMTVPPVQTPQVPAPQHAPPNPPQRQVDEDDRDYLDYMHFFSRAILLFALLYYYSSFSRVVVVMIMFFCISFYRRVSRRTQEMRRRAAERRNNESAQTQPVPVPPADVQVQETEPANNTPSAPPTTSDATLSQQSEERSLASMLSTTASLISAFFSSLIPVDPPVPVNIN